MTPEQRHDAIKKRKAQIDRLEKKLARQSKALKTRIAKAKRSLIALQYAQAKAVPPTFAAELELNAALAELEKALVDLHTGVVVEVPLEDGIVLSFGKRDGKWGLFTESKDGWNPLTSAPRRMRLLVGPTKIDELLCALKARMGLELQAVTEHTAKVREIVAALPAPKEQP
jgi:hypothetical protein